MNLRSEEDFDPNSEHEMDLFFCKTAIRCPHCLSMMNEIIELRMELGRREDYERKIKKNFTIAPTLYTFYKNRLDKRQLFR